MDLQPGFHQRIPFFKYCEWKNYINQSSLKKFLTHTPLEAKYSIDFPSKQTDAQFEGVVAHCLTLEPELFNDEFYLTPKYNLRKTADKEEKAKIAAMNIGKYAVNEAQYAQAQAIQYAVHDHAYAAGALAQSEREVSAVWIDPATALYCKGRFDLLNQDRHIVTDLKTCMSVSTDDVKRSITKWGYDLQVGFYAMGYRAIAGCDLKRFDFIFVTKHKPHVVRVVGFNESVIERFKTKAMRSLDIYATCLESDEWEGYPGTTDVSYEDLFI